MALLAKVSTDRRTGRCARVCGLLRSAGRPLPLQVRQLAQLYKSATFVEPLTAYRSGMTFQIDKTVCRIWRGRT